MSRSAQLAGAAALMAVRDAGFVQLNRDTAVCVGTALAPAIDNPPVSQRSGGRLETMAALMTGWDLSAAVARTLAVTGSSEMYTQGCSAGAAALGRAADWIRSGQATTVVVAGVDVPLTSTMAQWCYQHGYLANELPRPFSETPTGLAMSEGAGCIVLEEATQARARGATAYAEFAGWSGTRGGDTWPDTPGAAPYLGMALVRAFEQAGWPLSPIDLVCLTGLAAKTSDQEEIEAVRAVWREPKGIAVTAISGGLGHTFGASGVLQIIATACALTEQVVPPISNGARMASTSPAELVTGSAHARPLERAAVLSTGFGGSHVAVCLGRGQRLEVLPYYYEERCAVS
jgi:3-oxoacyl-[acyl-carrier-protein] synthase II